MKRHRFNQAGVDQFFKQKLDNVETVPTLGAWEKVHVQLETGSKGRDVKWWLAIAASISLILVISAMFYMQYNNIAQQPTFTENQIESSNPADTEITETKEVAPSKDINNSTTGHKPTTEYTEGLSSGGNMQYSQAAITISRDLNVDIQHRDPLLITLSISDPYVVREIASIDLSLDPRAVYDSPVIDRSKWEKALDFAKKVKSGDEKVFDIDLVKARKDLFAFAKNPKLKSETHN